MGQDITGLKFKHLQKNRRNGANIHTHFAVPWLLFKTVGNFFLVGKKKFPPQATYKVNQPALRIFFPAELRWAILKRLDGCNWPKDLI